MALTKESAGKRKRVDARCTAEREGGQMSGLPEYAELKAIAAAVFHRAFEDLGDPNERDDAEAFLKVGAWTGELPWARALGLKRDDVVARAESILFSKRAFERKVA
jgi:hypothetical protein